MNAVSKKFAMVAATIMLALSVTTIQVSHAEARGKGRFVAGALIGAAALAIIASQGRRDAYAHDYDEDRYHIHHDRWGHPYRCDRVHRSHRVHRRHDDYGYGRRHREW